MIRMGRIKLSPMRGSHLPVLMKAVSITTGPILELGCGLYSTTPLHWACFVAKRKLVTYEHHPAYYDFLREYACDFHEVHCIDDWDKIDISCPWAVAFVDHEPTSREDRDRRWREVQRLQHAEYVVVHDTERRNESQHKVSQMNALFKYHFQLRGTIPNTSVFSNFHDVSNFL